jgi:hypothetical protein
MCGMLDGVGQVEGEGAGFDIGGLGLTDGGADTGLF